MVVMVNKKSLWCDAASPRALLMSVSGRENSVNDQNLTGYCFSISLKALSLSDCSMWSCPRGGELVLDLKAWRLWQVLLTVDTLWHGIMSQCQLDTIIKYQPECHPGHDRGVRSQLPSSDDDWQAQCLQIRKIFLDCCCWWCLWWCRLMMWWVLPENKLCK